MAERLLRAKGLEIERLKSLIPDILTECGDYLESYGYFKEKGLTYDRIKEVWQEDRDLDHCSWHYSLQTRTRNPSSGRVNLFYDKDPSSGASELGIHVDSQSGEHFKEVNEMTKKIAGLLSREGIEYYEIPFINNFYAYFPGGFYRDKQYIEKDAEVTRIASEIDRLIDETSFDINAYEKIEDERRKATGKKLELLNQHAKPDDIWPYSEAAMESAKRRDVMIYPIYRRLAAMGCDEKKLRG